MPGSLSMGFSRQQYWSGLPCPSPGIFLTLGSNLCLLHLLHWQAGSVQVLHHPGTPMITQIIVERHDTVIPAGEVHWELIWRPATTHMGTVNSSITPQGRYS